MKPEGCKTKIFLDGGDPLETREIIKLLGFLDGQTTNPTLISKNPDVQKRLEAGDKFTEEEIYAFYRGVVGEISNLLPGGSVSVEVYSDSSTQATDMIRQGREMFSWISNAHIKLPITNQGLKAAEALTKEGMRVNMTLCFSQDQAAAVYAATAGAIRGQVFVSPFVGRLDDRGEDGMSLIKNILQMYKSGDGHVQVLVASVRNIQHFIHAIIIESDIITAPFDVLKEWAEKGFPVSEDGTTDRGEMEGLVSIPYKKLDINQDWDEFNISHPLTDKGIVRFSQDWNKLIA